MREHQSLTFAAKWRTTDGRLLAIEVTANFLQHEGHADHCAVGRDITPRQQTDALLGRRLRQLNTLNTLSAALLSSSDVAETYEATLNGFHQTCGIERMAILLTDREAGSRVVAWRGLSEQYRRAVEGHTFWTQDDPAPLTVVVANVEEDPGMVSLRSVSTDEGIRAFAAIPLVVRGRVIGKCMLSFPAPRRLSDDDLTSVETIARTAAIAIARQRADDEAWASANLLRVIPEATPDIVFAKDVKGRYLFCNPPGDSFVGHPLPII